MKYPKEFKEAISNLPSKEKDKLILRLLKKDVALTNRLFFELLNTNSVEQQREVVKKRIENLIERAKNTFYSIGYLTMDIRYMSGEINEHVYMTKDKFGEASLNLWMIIEVLEQHNEDILKETRPVKIRKFCTPVIARVFKILILIHKLHDDLFIEFEDGLQKLGKIIVDNPHLMNIAIKNGLDINWLLTPDIPQDIVQIHKEIRAQGFLK